MQHKSTASNSRGSHFLKEPISTDSANLNMKYRCLHSGKRAYSAACSFHYAVKDGRGKKTNQTKTTSSTYPPTRKKPQTTKKNKPHTHTKKIPPHQNTKCFKFETSTRHNIICFPHKTSTKAFYNSTHFKNISLFLPLFLKKATVFCNIVGTC